MRPPNPYAARVPAHDDTLDIATLGEECIDLLLTNANTPVTVFQPG